MPDSPVVRILNWLKAGYPEGIPQNDFPSVLLVLHQNLSDDDIDAIADELAIQSVSNGVAPVTADHIRDIVREKAFQTASDDDIRRVSARLAAGGWPLAAELS